jgi:hypothetical protein
MRKDFYKGKIILMLKSVNDERFLNQLRNTDKVAYPKAGQGGAL